MDATLDLAQSDYNLTKKYDFKRIDIIKEYAPDLPELYCEKSKIEQVLLNILKNSAEAMDNGGKISISTRFLPESAKIMIDERRRIPWSIEIGVSDNGPGINEKIKQTLFDPYTTTKIGASNSGLGLSIAQHYVEILGGKLEFESAQHVGTKFHFTLPFNEGKGFMMLVS